MLVALVAGCLLSLIVGYLLGKRIKNKPLEDDSVDTPGYQIAERALDTVPMGVVIADKKGEIVLDLSKALLKPAGPNPPPNP